MSWETVTAHHYTMTPADFADGCHTVTDAASGRIIGVGENKLGFHVRAVLNEPLCESCDNPIVEGVCHDCRIIHADLLPAESVGDPLRRVA
jgi:hypothetical protein